MPTIQVPLLDWSDYTPLAKNSKQFKRLADQLVTLSEQAKIIEQQQGEIRQQLYPLLKPLGDIKSVRYGEVRLERQDEGETTRFDKGKLMQQPIPCANPKCKTVNHVTPDVMERCMSYGKRKATVKVVPLKNKDGNDEE